MKRRSDEYADALQKADPKKIETVCKHVVASRAVLGYMDVARAMVLQRAIDQSSENPIESAWKLGDSLGISRQTLTNWFKNDLTSWIAKFYREKSDGNSTGLEKVSQPRSKVMLSPSDLHWIAGIREARGPSWRMLHKWVQNDASLTSGRSHLRGIAYTTIYRNRQKIMAAASGYARGMALLIKIPTSAVRNATMSDAAAITQLLTEVTAAQSVQETRERMQPLLASTDHKILVHEHENRVVGVLHAFEYLQIGAPGRIEISVVGVDQGCRRKGVGRRLFAKLKEWAVAQGFETICFRDSGDRNGSRPFFQALGFQATGADNTLCYRIELPQMGAGVPARVPVQEAAKEEHQLEAKPPAEPAEEDPF